MKKTILDNGLTVLLKENHSAPLIGQFLWYRVGARNEVPGLTGISHWCEHMQFKGTPKYPSEMLDKMISRVGGTWNASTSMDWTNFYEIVPADQIDLTIDLEADRMQNVSYLPEDVASERTVVISELEGSETEPQTKLSKAVDSAAFIAHPYGREVIGEKEDLRKITRDELYAHYRSYYRPNNAVFCMCGDFNSADILEKVKRAYGDIEPGTIPPCEAKPEGVIPERREVSESGPCEVTMMENVWRCPAGNSSEIYALHLLDSVLCGASSLNRFGSGSVGHKTCRLYNKLIRSGIAAGGSGGYIAMVDPYLYIIGHYLNPGHHPEEITAIIEEEISDLAQNGITEEEREKALKQTRALFAYANENITNQAFWMGYSAMFSDESWFERLIPGLEAVTNRDIQEFAGKYLSPNHQINGVYCPEGGEA